jgi:hypothetical protein
MKTMRYSLWLGASPSNSRGCCENKRAGAKGGLTGSGIGEAND